MAEEFSTIQSLRNESKRTKTLLNLERFNLLPSDIQSAIDVEREKGSFPQAMEPIPQDEFNEYMNFMQLFVGEKIASKPEDFAKMWYASEKAGAFITDKEVKKEIGAFVGGIIAPSLVPYLGQVSFPARMAMYAQKYPRMAKILAAFVGGAGGSVTWADDYMEALGYGVREASGEGAYQFLAKVFGNRILKLFRGRNGESLEEGADAALRIAMQGGEVLTPARLSTSKTIDLLENFAEVSFFGGGRILRAGEKGQEAVQGELVKFLNKEFAQQSNKNLLESESKLIESFIKNATQENIDDALKVFITGGRDFYKEAIKGAYKALDKQVAQVVGSRAGIIDLNPLKRQLKRQLNIVYGTDIVPKEGPIQSIIKYIDQVTSKNKGIVDFNTAKNVRSFLLQKTGAFQVGGTIADEGSKTVAAALQGSVTKYMEKGLADLIKSGSYKEADIKMIKQLYQQANQIFKNGKKTFNHKFVTGLLAGNTEGMTKEGVDISKSIYKSLVTANNPKRIKSFYNLIDDALKNKVISDASADTIKKKIQGQFLVDVIGKNVDETSGIINAKKVLGEIKGFKGKGSTVGALFEGNEQALKNFESYLRSLNLAQQRGIGRQQGGLALFSGQFKSAGALAGSGFGLGFVLSGGDPGVGQTGALASSLVILGGPAMISRAFTNRKFVNNLMNMQMSKTGSSLFNRSFTRIINDGIAMGLFDTGNAEQIVKENESIFGGPDKLEERFPWLKDLDKGDTPDANYTNPDIEKFENFDIDLQQNLEKSDREDVEEPESLINVNLDDTTTLPEISVPEPDSSIMADVISTPISAIPSTGTTPGPVGSGMNPQTQQRLESVGLPLFAAHGGIASLMNRKKPKQMVV